MLEISVVFRICETFEMRSVSKVSCCMFGDVIGEVDELDGTIVVEGVSNVAVLHFLPEHNVGQHFSLVWQ